MRIIHHGNKYEVDQIICPECQCEFIYTLDDIQTEDNYYNDINETFCTVEIVHCPECDYEIIIPKDIN